MKNLVAVIVILFASLAISGMLNSTMAKNNNTEIKASDSDWDYYGKVTALYFGEFNHMVCIGDATKYSNISHKFYELEDEGGYLLKPLHVTISIFYRNFNGEKQYRMINNRPRKDNYLYFSLNPHESIEYVIDNNNRPVMKQKDVSNYSHFVESDGSMYFIKMY